jgi:hypothetical protein
VGGHYRAEGVEEKGNRDLIIFGEKEENDTDLNERRKAERGD